MKFQIKSWRKGSILFEGEFGSLKLCLEAAIGRRANLSGANLSGAYLSGANLSGVQNAELALARTRIVPQEGTFVGWKKLRDGEIARLVIPEGAARVNAVSSRKCRAERVFVTAIWDENGKEITGPVAGIYDSRTVYEAGKETLSDKFDPSITKECSHGIHFYMTKEEVEAH